MKIFHLVKIRFDRRTKAITQDWLNARYNFFEKYTLKSLQAQTFKDFHLWFDCQHGMHKEGIIDNLVDMFLDNNRVSFTFNDLLSIKDLSDENQLDQTKLRDSDYVYITRIDSDDIFSSRALKIANDCEPTVFGQVEASLFRRGYMYDINSERLGVYHNPSPPFHTLMVPTPIFLDPKKYKALNYGDHSKVNSTFPCIVLEEWQVCVLIHGNNFITTFDYSAEKDNPVPLNWSINNFIDQPVVFDVDDFCDKWNIIPTLDRLKERYPNLKCTLFTIPMGTRDDLLKEAFKRKDWIELGVHGITHEPNEEMNHVTQYRLTNFLKSLDYKKYYSKIFRPPGWAMPIHAIEACNEAGLSVAIHKRDERELGKLCTYGYYCCDNRFPYWHGHTHDVCGNFIDQHLNSLLQKWPQDQKFMFASEAVLVPQTRWQEINCAYNL